MSTKKLKTQDNTSNHEPHNYNATRHNLVENVTFGLVAGKQDSIKEYIGKSCELDIETITPYPAITKEYGLRCKGFGGYKVPLAPLANSFSEIRFRGRGNGKDVVCGYIVDNNGYVESVATECDHEGYATLPLTPHSHILYASVPTSRNKPVWERITIELLSRRQKLAMESYVSNIVMCAREIARDVEQMEYREESATPKMS